MASTERDKMISGEMYNAADPDLVESRLVARDLLLEYNTTSERKEVERTAIMQKLIPNSGADLFIQVADVPSLALCVQSGFH